MTKRLFFAGYGYTAQALKRRLDGAGWRFAGSTRSAERAASLEANGVAPTVWAGDAAMDFETLAAASHLLVSAPPGEAGCPVLVHGARAIAESGGLRWIGYCSTNGVYGDHEGGWVDEDAPLRATSPRARRRIAAEEAWRAFASARGIDLVIFRLPGIYGPGRSAFDSLRDGSARRVVKPGQVFSRAHVDDIAAAIAAAIDRPQAHDLYNIADDEPAPPQDVVEYAARLLGVAPPPLVAFEEADLSEMAKSFYADNKRVSNARMKDALAVSLRYPTYREGLEGILAAEKH